MIKSIVLGLLLSLALVAPVSAATKLSASSGDIGNVVVGSCNLETFAGCVVKTITITNVSGGRVRIAGISVPPTGDIGLAPTSQAGDCSRLPLSGRLWVLRAGRSCAVRLAVAPATVGPMQRTLRLFNPKGNTLVSVAITAEGV